MEVTKTDLIIKQGATFNTVFRFEDQNGALINWSAYTARLQVRPSASSSVVLLDCTSGNGKIVITGPDIAMNVSAAATAALSFDKAYYDLELVLPDFYGAGNDYVYRPLQGAITLSREITR